MSCRVQLIADNAAAHRQRYAARLAGVLGGDVFGAVAARKGDSGDSGETARPTLGAQPLDPRVAPPALLLRKEIRETPFHHGLLAAVRQTDLLVGDGETEPGSDRGCARARGVLRDRTKNRRRRPPERRRATEKEKDENIQKTEISDLCQSGFRPGESI